MDIAFFTPSYPGLVKIYEVSLQRQGGAMSMIFFINFIHHKSSGQENCLVRSSSKDDMNETIANLLILLQAFKISIWTKFGISVCFFLCRQRWNGYYCPKEWQQQTFFISHKVTFLQGYFSNTPQWFIKWFS